MSLVDQAIPLFGHDGYAMLNLQSGGGPGQQNSGTGMTVTGAMGAGMAAEAGAAASPTRTATATAKLTNLFTCLPFSKIDRFTSIVLSGRGTYGATSGSQVSPSGSIPTVVCARRSNQSIWSDMLPIGASSISMTTPRTHSRVNIKPPIGLNAISDSTAPSETSNHSGRS